MFRNASFGNDCMSSESAIEMIKNRICPCVVRRSKIELSDFRLLAADVRLFDTSSFRASDLVSVSDELA